MTRKLNGPLGPDYQTGPGTAIPVGDVPLTYATSLDGRLDSAESTITRLGGYNPEVWSNYRTKSNGPIASTFDSGQTATVYDSGLPLEIVSGAMGMDQDGVLHGAYLTAALNGPVTRFGGSFFFTGGTGGTTGSAAFLIPSATYVHGVDLAAHMLVGTTTLYYQVRTGGGQVPFTTLLTYVYPTPLVADGTEYSVEVQIDGDTATIIAPDGTIHTVTDAQIDSNNAGFMTWEPYQFDLEADPVVWFSEVWADSAEASTLRSSTIKATRLNQMLSLYQPAIQAAQYAPSSQATLSLSGSRKEIDASLRLTVTYPASGNILFELQCYIDSTSGYVFAIPTPNANLSGGAVPMEMVNAASADGMCRNSIIVSGTPGTTATLYCALWVASGSASVLSYNGVGRISLVKATPL